MPFSRLHKISQCLLFLASVSGIFGCSSMGGNMANSSGMGYYKKGNYAAAAGEFQNALATNPQNPDYMANFAKSRMKMGDMQTAEQYFRQALMVDPAHQPSYHGLAELMLDQGRAQEAHAMLSTWAGTQPYIAESHVELAWLQRETGNLPAAAQSLERALQVNPNHATALAHMGQYYEETGQTDEAVAYYQDSLQADWNQPEVHSRMAAASQKVGAESPMAATAMARGVHPYSIPRQQTAFGPPTQGAQMAQIQMMQTQMAMAGQTLPAPVPTHFASSAGSFGPVSPVQQTTGSHMAWRHANVSDSPWSPAPSPTVSYGTSGQQFPLPVSPQTMGYPQMTPAESGSGQHVLPSSQNAAVPIPDPAFSAFLNGSPVTTASFTGSSGSGPGAPAGNQAPDGNSELPLVEPF